ncbi:helix-turn-helix domain-containing protein [Bacillus sp. DJP31]|uniref:response regulator transcription factor n=1 Tax=Bacillus sp. DJP31 TaxID=3409789 RepID=UPI003BB81139
MKAIIIDDEKHVREGLLLLADWNKYDIDTIYEAEDGEEAIKLITLHQPEIIFTDMSMPRGDGISLLKWIHSSNMTSKTIVISGYDDFEYMRNAIHYKSFDYILKPIDPEVLNETLERAVKEWNNQALTRRSMLEENKVINEVKPMYWDRLFSGILTKSQIPISISDKINNQYFVMISKEQYSIAVIPLDEVIMKQFQGDVDLAFFTVSNICNELLNKDNYGVAFRNINKEQELVLLFWKQNTILMLVEEIFSLISQFTKVHCTIALGKQLGSLPEAYESAQHALMKHDLVHKKTIVTYKDVSYQPTLHLLDYSQEFKWAIQSGSMEQVDTILQRIFQSFEDSTNCLTLEQIEHWENEFKLLRKSWLKEYEIPESIQLYFGMNYWMEDGAFSYQRFKGEKKKEFYDLLSTLSDVKYKKEKNNMQKIEEYLRHNYQQDINLQEIADRFYLSREYISRKFKQEFHETLTDYLTKIRVEKAKDLLENPHLKIYDIAYQVGYQNEKYFSKVFKKSTGQTPNEYRNSLAIKQ